MNFFRGLVPAFRMKQMFVHQTGSAVLRGSGEACRTSVARHVGSRNLSGHGSDSSWKSNIPPPPPPPKPVGTSNAPTFEPPFSDTVRSPPIRFQSRNVPAPKYDPKILEELGIEKASPSRIAEVLAEENLTIGELKMLVDMKMHLATDESYSLDNKPAQVSDEFDPSKITHLNPKRTFYPGQTYDPEDLSPETHVDFNKLRQENRRKGCSLGGKKGPKIDFANVALLSRYVTDTGRILGRDKTRVCAKKQRELRRAIIRARVINLLPYLHKLPEFMRKDSQ